MENYLMLRPGKKQVIVIVILILIALASHLFIADQLSSDELYQNIKESLDQKQKTVVALAASSAALSTLLSLLPGDMASPIANQIAQLTSYFIVILGAIILEKMLLSVMGYVAFGYIIPFACLLGIGYNLYRYEPFKKIAIKLTIFAIIATIAIPVTIKTSDLIYSAHLTSTSESTSESESESTSKSAADLVAGALKFAEETTTEIEAQSDEISKEEQSLINKIGSTIKSLPAKLKNQVSKLAQKGQTALSNFIEAIAILIVTTCLVPIFILMIFAWTIKMLFGLDAPAELLKLKKVKPIPRPGRRGDDDDDDDDKWHKGDLLDRYYE